MNGIEFLETVGFGMQGEPIGMEEIDGIYKLGGRYEPGPTPKDGVVDVKYHVSVMPTTCCSDTTETRKTPLTFELNSGQVCEGFNRAVKTLGLGDSAMFSVPPHLAFGKKGKFGIIPPDTWVLFDIELIGAYQPVNTPKLLIENGRMAKDEGNKKFKGSDITGAMTSYSVAIEKLEKLETDTQKQKDEVKDILIACHANMAAANLKLRYWDDAIESCHKVFQFDPTHIKASYRIGQAYIAKGEFDLGIEIVKKGLEKQPNDPNLLKTLSDLQKRQAIELERQKKTYAKMFK